MEYKTFYLHAMSTSSSSLYICFCDPENCEENIHFLPTYLRVITDDACFGGPHLTLKDFFEQSEKLIQKYEKH